MRTRDLLEDMINKGAYMDCAKDAHEAWRNTKISQGWTYAETRDNAKKTNPLLRPYEELPTEMQGQNALTPYAVMNYLRVEQGELETSELEGLLGEIVAGNKEGILQEIGEYVHSHFLAAQLARGATVATRDDMKTYERLTPDQRTWDTESAKAVMKYMVKVIGEYTV